MEVGGQRLHAPSPPNSINEISCRALGLALSPLLLHIHLSDMAFYWSLQTRALQFGTAKASSAFLLQSCSELNGPSSTPNTKQKALKQKLL